jgi:hypothetical protein
MRIRKRINKRIERDEDGVQVSGAVNAVVSVNVGEDGSTTRATSRQSLQREGEAAAEPEGRESSGSQPPADDRAQELPDREGTYDELREEAARRRDREARRREAAAEVQEANEGDTDE